MKKVYIIHENGEWTKPLIESLEVLGTPYEEWFLHEGTIDLTKEPPNGIFYNRMSASSHTRDHRYAPEYTAGVLDWLEAYDRKIINKSRALQFEVSKIKQYVQLEKFGIKTPKTVAAIGKKQIIEAAKSFEGSFITKHNRAGKGLGVKLFHTIEALEAYVFSDDFEPSIDGITLIQQYIQSPEPYIIRNEFVGGEYLYSVSVNTSEGFELCPADACSVEDLFCPVGETPNKFTILKGFKPPALEAYKAFLDANDIHISGIEMIQDESGEYYSYDVNTNTNYNSDAESVADIYGMKAIAQYLTDELNKL